MNLLNCEDVVKASRLIENHIKNTPIISNSFINKILNSQVFFKMDSQQVTQSFKARGAFNAVLAYYQKHCKFPKKIVVHLTGVSTGECPDFVAKQILNNYNQMYKEKLYSLLKIIRLIIKLKATLL